MKHLPWIVLVIVVALLGHFCINQSNQIAQLKQNLNLTRESLTIESNQVRDLMYALRQSENEKNSVSTQSFVAGVLDAMQRQDHYQEIWHDGYNRGSEVQLSLDQIKEIPVATNEH